MKRFAACVLLLACLGQSGCSLCCTPFDYAYAGYGGSIPRDNRFHGRVGSAYEPAGAIPGELTPHDYEPPVKEETPPPAPDLMEEAAPDAGSSTSGG
jgi:hypothetical protein